MYDQRINSNHMQTIRHLFCVALGGVLTLAGCAGSSVAGATATADAGAGAGSDAAGNGDAAGNSDAGARPKVVEVVLFTHIEDTSPSGTLGSAPNKADYLALRAKLIEVATLAKARNVKWVLQPDWKYLEAALLYEDAALVAATRGHNLFVHLRDDLGAAIDPHSHEAGGYNYTDVAYLLGKLGVGGSTVIGGHIWDPSLPQFAHWERFRVPVAGLKYPTAVWRGDILIGAGTPNHVNDPLVSGAWRPKAPQNFFVDDPAANIVAFGAWHNDVAGVQELVALYAAGTVPTTTMLTASWNIQPADLKPANGPTTVDQTVFAPLAALRDQGLVEVTDFTTLKAKWQRDFGGVAGMYKP